MIICMLDLPQTGTDLLMISYGWKDIRTKVKWSFGSPQALGHIETLPTDTHTDILNQKYI